MAFYTLIHDTKRIKGQAMATQQPLQNQTLYAELLEQVKILERFRSVGLLEGSFVTKVINGERYVYFQHYGPGAAKQQAYLGKESESLAHLIAQYQKDKESFAPDVENIHRLCSQLRAGGAHATDYASARVIRQLADSGVFRAGGVLVGTHACTVLGNVLGVLWDHSALRTHDIDIATGIAVAIPQLEADIPSALESLKMGFFPVPPFNRKHPSTSFKVRGSALRLDVLTPQKGPSADPIYIPRFRTGAQPVRFLDYLLEETIEAVVINGGGVLVTVPDPARYAVHKMIVSGERDASAHAKSEKDLFQASQILSVLEERRPGDVKNALAAATSRGPGWAKRVENGLLALEQRHGLRLRL